MSDHTFMLLLDIEAALQADGEREAAEKIHDMILKAAVKDAEAIEALPPF